MTLCDKTQKGIQVMENRIVCLILMFKFANFVLKVYKREQEGTFNCQLFGFFNYYKYIVQVLLLTGYICTHRILVLVCRNL